MMGDDPLFMIEDGLVECESKQSNKRRRSVAWDHFERLPGGDKDSGKARCVHCNMIMTAAPRSGTSHLKRHVERCPKRLVLDVVPIRFQSGGSNDLDSGNIVDSTPRRKFSKVWEEFERVLVEDTNEPKAKCTHCKVLFSAAAKNGTSHLKRHLEKCPKRVVLDAGNDVKLGHNLNFGQVGKIVNINQTDPLELRKYISLCIIEGGHPFSLVEEKGFRRVISKACPQFKPFGRSVVRKELFSMYVKERENVKELIATAPGKICVACDKWKPRDSVDEYICVSAYFVDYQWKLQRRVLSFRAVTPPYDGTCNASEVAYSLTQWNVEHKLFSITMDETLYDESTVSTFQRGLVDNCGTITQVRCYADVLNHIAKMTLKLINDILGKTRELVKYVNKSSVQRKEFFNLAETKFQLPVKKGLKLDILSRWNSTYKLIDRVLYYKSVLMHTVDRDESMRSIVLSEEEWQDLSVAHKFLKVLYDVMLMFVGSKYPAANLYLKGVLMVHCRMLEIARGPRMLLTDMVKQLLGEFDDYWSKNNELLSCAAILDPRYKVKFVEYSFMKLNGGSNVTEHVNRVVSGLYCYFGDYKRQSAAFPSECGGSSSARTNFASGSDERDVFGDYNQFLSMTSRSQDCKSVLDLYLEEPSYDLNCDLDVLDFWNKNSMRYPELSVMARDILSLPVSTVSSKSAFYIGSKLLSSVHNSITPETVQALNCLQDWLCAQSDSDYFATGAEDSSDDAGYDDDDDDSVLTDCF